MSFDHAAATYMRRALELAQQGSGLVHPNPLVGAVVVRDGVVVGEGYHRAFGEAHAEVAALNAAGQAARGATLYVTLEPCAHHGKTPPCTAAIIAAGVAEVVYAVEDPTPRAGGGAAQLQAAGITVRSGVENDAARTLNAAFFHVHERQAPYVALKLALSLDGRLAARQGVRTTITGPEANREVHRLRAAFDAILIGRGTAAVDDPLLTVRDVRCRVPPIRVVVDSDARLGAGSRLVQTVTQAPLWILAAADADAGRMAALSACGVRVVVTDRGPDGVDLAQGLHALATAGVQTVFAEGGGSIAATLLRCGLVQRLYLLVAPLLLGTGGVLGFNLDAPPATAWRFVEERRVGADVLLILDRIEVD